jgi:hypothetical protein
MSTISTTGINKTRSAALEKIVRQTKTRDAGDWARSYWICTYMEYHRRLEGAAPVPDPDP